MIASDRAIIWLSTTGARFARLVVSAYDSACGPRPTEVILVPPDATRPRGIFMFLLAIQSIAVADARMLADPSIRASVRDARCAEAPYKHWGARISFLGSINSRAAEALLSERPSYLISAGLPEILSKRVLALAPLGAINVHNGRLPDARGHFATFWEYRKKLGMGTVSVHRMIERVDAGPVLETENVALAGKSLLRTIIEKKRVGGRLLARAAMRDLVEFRNSDQLSGGDSPQHIPPALPWPTIRQLATTRLRGA